MPDPTLDLLGALNRALAEQDSDDPVARNDARVLLELACVARHGFASDFRELALAAEGQENDALHRRAALFGLNEQLDALRAEMDWASIDAVDGYLDDRRRQRRQEAENTPEAIMTKALFRLIDDNHLDDAEAMLGSLSQGGQGVVLPPDIRSRAEGEIKRRRTLALAGDLSPHRAVPETERGGMIDLSFLDPPETAPQDGRQFIAWAIDENGNGRNRPADDPRWCVVQWAPTFPGVGVSYWKWSSPGRSTSVQIIGWLDLPWNDVYGDYAIGKGIE